MKNQLTDKQLTANKENAKRGGVKTDEGKHVVRFNARKHGVLAVLMTDYEQNLFNQFLEQLYVEFRPVSFVEEILVERMAICYLRLFRSGKAEMEFMQSRLEPDEKLEIVFGKKGYKPTINFDDIEKLQNTFMRYETSIENRFYKAIRVLERIQRMNKGEFVPAPIAIDVNNSQENGFVSQNN